MKSKSAYHRYCVSVTGWEDYDPYWFETAGSIEYFKDILVKCFDRAIKQMSKKLKSDYWEGRLFMEYVVKELKKEYIEHIKPECEISIGGGCIYGPESKSNPRPEIFTKEQWNKLIRHNASVRANIHRRWKIKK